jgi:hypothetical protein
MLCVRTVHVASACGEIGGETGSFMVLVVGARGPTPTIRIMTLQTERRGVFERGDDSCVGLGNHSAWGVAVCTARGVWVDGVNGGGRGSRRHVIVVMLCVWGGGTLVANSFVLANTKSFSATVSSSAGPPASLRND